MPNTLDSSKANVVTSIEPQPHHASSVYYAIKTAAQDVQPALYGLYALQRKWREAANYTDNHQAVSTLNWWHEELEQSRAQRSEHPALQVLQTEQQLKPEIHQALQNLLHGHMHWHHLNRADDLAQLQPTIDAIGGEFARLWLLLCDSHLTETFIQSAGRALWWIDSIRHMGHNLSNQRIWIPMQWLAEQNLPAYLLLKTQSPQSLKNPDWQQNPAYTGLINHLIQHTQSELNQYQQQFSQLSAKQQKTIKSWKVLMNLRADLFAVIKHEPADVFGGLVSLSPLRKWWQVIRS